MGAKPARVQPGFVLGAGADGVGGELPQSTARTSCSTAQGMVKWNDHHEFARRQGDRLDELVEIIEDVGWL